MKFCEERFLFRVSPVRIVLVESIPVGVEFNSSTSHPSIFQAWMSLMSEARSSVDIASFYWTLTNRDTGTQEPSAVQVRRSKRLDGKIQRGGSTTGEGEPKENLFVQGETVLQTLSELSGKLKVRIAVNTPQEKQREDLRLLNDSGKRRPARTPLASKKQNVQLSQFIKILGVMEKRQEVKL